MKRLTGMAPALIAVLLFSPAYAQGGAELREARAALRSGRFELAEQTVRMYLAAHPASPEAQYLLGFILFRRDRPRESLAAFTRAAAIQKPSAAALKIVGLDYALLGDYPDAI